MRGKRERAEDQEKVVEVVELDQAPAQMASFTRVEVFLGFKHSLELKDLSSGERCSHLLPTRLPVRTRLESIINIFSLLFEN